MSQEVYVIKFGNLYLEENQGYIKHSGGITLSLVEDLFEARRFWEKDLEKFKEFMAIGGRVIELSYYEMDKNYSIELELKEDLPEEDDENEE